MKKVLLTLFILVGIVGLKVTNDFFPIKYKEEVLEISNEIGMDKSLVFAMIKVESDFREKVVSHKGAVGLMQVLPSTAKWILAKEGYNPNEYDLYNSRDNIFVGVLYLKYLNDRFEGDLQKIMAAYNGGSSRIKDDKWKEIDETRFYVKKVKVAHFFYRIKLKIIEVL